MFDGLCPFKNRFFSGRCFCFLDSRNFLTLLHFCQESSTISVPKLQFLNHYRSYSSEASVGLRVELSHSRMWKLFKIYPGFVLTTKSLRFHLLCRPPIISIRGPKWRPLFRLRIFIVGNLRYLAPKSTRGHIYWEFIAVFRYKWVTELFSVLAQGPGEGFAPAYWQKSGSTENGVFGIWGVPYVWQQK